MMSHGMLCAPGSGSGSGGSGADDKDTGPLSGHHRCVRYDRPDDQIEEPLPVILARGTFFKFFVLIFGSMLVVISGALAIYWKHHYSVSTHMGNQTIHLTSGERAKFETKIEAQAQRKKMVKAFEKHAAVKYREIVVEQNEKFQDWSEAQEQKQEHQLRRILSEVRGVRRAVRTTGP